MPTLMANQLTDQLVALVGQIQGGDAYPFAISDVKRGRFFEDLDESASLPVATVVPAGSSGVQGQQMPSGAQRVRQYQIEVVLDLDHYPGVERDVVMTNAEWSLCKALGGMTNNRTLGGRALGLLVGEVEYGWPVPGNSVASLTASVAITYLENYA